LPQGARIVLIAGGEGKGQDFAPLRAAVARHCRAVMLIGRDGAAIGAAVGDVVPAMDHASLKDAVQAAASRAAPGDIVLLSPACASFDMFRDYGHRALVFVAAVRELARVNTVMPASDANVGASADQGGSDA
jgi:UDP-N-acetylmuramoylalanine--D-glutamate ligase